MSSIPQSLEETISEAKAATLRALADGHLRIQIELVMPEIALKAQSLAWEFSLLWQELGSGLKVFFPDTGAAALARRDWGEIAFKVSDLGTSRTPLESKISDDDQIFLVVSPSSVEVNLVEKLCNLSGDRPVILLIPQLEDVSIVGIGYAARQLRERFLSTLESAYYFRPLEAALVLRSYPSLWQVWFNKSLLASINESLESPSIIEISVLESSEIPSSETRDYELISECKEKPMGEALEGMINQAINPISDSTIQDHDAGKNSNIGVKKTGFLGNLQKLLKALNN